MQESQVGGENCQQVMRYSKPHELKKKQTCIFFNRLETYDRNANKADKLDADMTLLNNDTSSDVISDTRHSVV